MTASRPGAGTPWQPEQVSLVFLTCPREPAYLPATLEEMRMAGITEFLLTAYSARVHEEPWLRRGRTCSSYVAGDFYGTQAMFYPASEIQPVRSLIWTHGVHCPEEPYDLLIKRRAIEKQHLYTTRHSLMQHVGSRSTGLGDGRHRSPSFDRAWPEPEKIESLTRFSEFTAAL